MPPWLSTLPHFIFPVLVHFEVPWPCRLNTGFPFSFRCSGCVTLANCFLTASVSPHSWNCSWLKKSGTSEGCLSVLRGMFESRKVLQTTYVSVFLAGLKGRDRPSLPSWWSGNTTGTPPAPIKSDLCQTSRSPRTR